MQWSNILGMKDIQTQTNDQKYRLTVTIPLEQGESEKIDAFLTKCGLKKGAFIRLAVLSAIENYPTANH